jgi:hypothetical protein
MCSMFKIEDIKCLRLTIFDMSFLDLHNVCEMKLCICESKVVYVSPPSYVMQ